MDSPALSLLRLNGRVVDVQRGLVTDLSGVKVTLRPQAAKVLEVLATKAGELVTKDELSKAVWGSIAVTDDSLVQCVTEIRRALGDGTHAIIKTVLKRGYVLEVPHAEKVHLVLARRWAALIAAGALSLAAWAAVLLWPVAHSDLEPPAIAVLPFQNINGDEKWARFANGLTDDIISDLARFRDIPVIARTSTEIYRESAYDVREIGKGLNVKYVLEGSLQVDGYRLRVTAHLINAKTGAYVWSQSYDRPAAELLVVQDEITQKIAASLTGWQGQLTESERVTARRKNAIDLNAYDFWLLGIEAKHRMTPRSQIEARAYFEQGLKLAPDFMPLVRDMAVSFGVEMDLGSPIDYPAAVNAQWHYAERALALDQNDAIANFMMALAYASRGDDEQAQRYQQRALELAPNNADVLMILAWSWGGWETERAIDLIERTQKLNPRYPSWWNFPIAQAYFAARKYDKAYAAAKQIGESPNQAAYLAMSSAQIGNPKAAEAAAKVLEMNPNWTAESMFPYQNFKDEALLTEGAAKAGLPVCMSTRQIAAYSSGYRMKQCEEKRAQAGAN